MSVLACATAPQGPAATTYRGSCMQMETVVIEAEFAAGRIEGRTIIGDLDEFEGLGDVQVAARSVSTKKVVFVISDSEGRFSLPRLEPDRYELSTCLDGFDSVEFTVRVSRTAEQGGFLLFLRPSEAGTGILDVRYDASE